MKMMRVIRFVLVLTFLGFAHNLCAMGFSMQITAPSYEFQSTSAYSDQWQQKNYVLKADGTVDESAYLSNSTPSGPRRGNTPPPPGPTPDPNSQLPIGDGMLVLLLLAMAYAGTRVYRRVLVK